MQTVIDFNKVLFSTTCLGKWLWRNFTNVDSRSKVNIDEIIKEYHDGTSGRDLGVTKTIEKINCWLCWTTIRGRLDRNVPTYVPPFCFSVGFSACLSTFLPFGFPCAFSTLSSRYYDSNIASWYGAPSLIKLSSISCACLMQWFANI